MRFGMTVGATLLLAVAAGRAFGAEGGEAPAGTVDPALLKRLCREEWGGLYASGKKAGYMQSVVSIEKLDNTDVVVFKSRMTMKMQYGGLAVEAGAVSYQEFSVATGELLLLRSDMTMNGQPMTKTEIVRDGDSYRQNTTVGGQTVKGTPPECQHDLRSALGPQLMAMDAEAKVGDTCTSEMLVPETNSAVRMVSEIKGEKELLLGGVAVPAWEVETSVYKLPAPEGEGVAQETPMAVMNIVIDREGRMIEGQLLGPFSFRMESEESAKRLDRAVDIMKAAGLRLDRRLAKPRDAAKVTLSLEGMPEASIVNDDRQKYTPQPDGSCLLELRPQAAPGPAAALTEAERERLAGWLKPTEYLQSADPKIVELARKVVGDEKDPYKAACRLNAWVDVNVENEFTPMLSNALDTLKSRRGDCGEHAALFVALCRAAGIPAREVAGLAYEQKSNLLGGHAWAEVHVGGRWVAMDPTFGEELADALHIKVAEGGMSGVDGMLRLADLLGRLKVKVVGEE